MDEYEITAEVFRDLVNKSFIFVMKDDNAHVMNVMIYMTEDIVEAQEKFRKDVETLFRDEEAIQEHYKKSHK